MSGAEIGVYGFLGFMVLLGIVAEFGKRQEKQRLKNVMEGRSAMDNGDPTASTALALRREPITFESMIRQQTKLSEDRHELQMRYYSETNEMSEEEYRLKVERIEAADAALQAEFDATPDGRAMAQYRVQLEANKTFQADETYLSPTGNHGIAIERAAGKIAFFDSVNRTILDFADIMSSEVVIDSETMVKTDRVGQIGGAMIGGALTGGFGAVVMAMGAKKKHVDTVRHVALKVRISDMDNPIRTVCFYQKGHGSTPAVGVSDAERWQAMLTIAIEDALEPHDVVQMPAPVGEKLSAADEIRKLATLKADGLLSDEEFAALKGNLLKSMG